MKCKSFKYLALGAVIAVTLGAFAFDAAAVPTNVTNCTTLTGPGAFVLQNNINPTASSVNCILIVNDNVNFNLNGFQIKNNPSYPGQGIGIRDGGAYRKGTVITNGAITGFANGIDLWYTTGARIDFINSSDNAFDGIQVGKNCSVSNSTANKNGAEGIQAGDACSVINNVATKNGDEGIDCGTLHETNGPAVGGCTIIGNTANENGDGGDDDNGINVGKNSTVEQNTASHNTDTGIQCETEENGEDRGDCTIKNNTTNENGEGGIECGGRCTIVGNTANDNGGDGIESGEGSTILHNTASSNKDAGIACDDQDCTIEQNTANHNGEQGIECEDEGGEAGGCTIKNNTTNNNGDDGIGCFAGCTIFGNTANENEEDGIDCSGAGCTIIHNTTRGNTDDGIKGTGPCLIAENVSTNNGTNIDAGTCATDDNVT
jgi:parallel beta-helix repeat protein